MYFPTRFQNSSATAIDNIFIETSKFANYTTFPPLHGLSDYNAQLIMIYDTGLKLRKEKSITIKKIDTYTMFDFQMKLSFESWETVFENNDKDTMFNAFLNTYLRIFYSSFPLKKLNTKPKSNTWITLGIRNYCKHKRDLPILCRNSNESKLETYYKTCTILSNFTQEAKKHHYNKQIENSNNKMKTVGNITKSLTGKKIKNEITHQLNIVGNITCDSQLISESFNNYFLLIAETNYKNTDKSYNTSLQYLYQAFNNPLLNIKYQNILPQKLKILSMSKIYKFPRL